MSVPRIIENGDCLEFCTGLPSSREDTESPLFSLMGNDWNIRFTMLRCYYYDYYDAYIQLKNARTAVRSFKFNFHVKKNDKISLTDNISKEAVWTAQNEYQYCFWYVLEGDLEKHLLDNYQTGHIIKFSFCFHFPYDPTLVIKRKSEKQPESVARNTVSQESPRSADAGMDIHLKALCRDFSKLLDESSRSDVKIKCEDKTFNAHRNILEIRSPVLSAMLQSKMAEDETGLIKVEDFNASIVQGFLRYLYSGALPQFEVDTAKQFYEIADKYAVEELKTACSDYLTKNLSESNSCEVLVLADQHSDKDFRESVISYIVEKNIPQCGKEWADFCENHCKLAIEVQNLYIKKLSQK